MHWVYTMSLWHLGLYIINTRTLQNIVGIADMADTLTPTCPLPLASIYRKWLIETKSLVLFCFALWFVCICFGFLFCLRKSLYPYLGELICQGINIL